MRVELILAPSFEREAKPLVKKYASLRQELRVLMQQLFENPQLGTPLGQNC